MRILFLTEIPDPGVGSSVRQMYGHAAWLREQGHEVCVVSTVRDGAEASPTVIEGTQVFRLHSDYPVRFRPWVSLHNKAIDAPFQAILEEWKPDIVHAHLVHTHLGYHALTQARRAGAKVVFTAHDVMVFCYQKLTCFHGGEAKGGKDNDVTARLFKCLACQRFRFRPGRNRRIRSILERDVDRFVVVSDALGQVIEANGIQVHHTVHNALVPLKELPSEAQIEGFRSGLGLTGKQVLAMGGRLHEQKGVGKLLEMLALLAPEFPELRLIVMGKSDIYDREFKPQAEALGIADRIVPTGWLDGDELQWAYAATDVFVTPSLCFDTFGLVNLEAMQHAKPVVATSFGGSKEVIDHGQTGAIENPFDVKAYSEHLARLLRDDVLRRDQGQAGQDRFRERFTMGRLALQYMEIYSDLLE
ncbi:MAG: glycosyltransferase family 4 protein [Planctomycetota bacterium]|nr:glycosyltransferase family 4 protein [Planctomycetota bacterium]